MDDKHQSSAPATWDDLPIAQNTEEYKQHMKLAAEESLRVFNIEKKEKKEKKDEKDNDDIGLLVIKEGPSGSDDGPAEQTPQQKGLYVEYLEEEIQRLQEKLKEVYLAVDSLQALNPGAHQQAFGHISTQFMQQNFPDYCPTGFDMSGWDPSEDNWGAVSSLNNSEDEDNTSDKES
jgi:hypothetical protein